MSKKFYCAKCGVLVVEIVKGKIKPDLYIECKKCQAKIDLPEDFSNIFGGKI